uniref:Uncharacterized protein n=1 Tax=Bracon brevicornis TaxID=1563983 RepID=A0A6V7LFN6_9HYME
MEIVIENQSDTQQNTPYGTLPGTSGHVPSNFYYSTLPTRLRSQQHQIQTDQVRRIDKSGLLEIPEPEPARNRSRHLTTGGENIHHTGTLPRRIDRLGLLEAVPEVPDQVQNSPELLKNDRQLTGAENKDQQLNIIKSPINVQIDKNNTPITSPYLRRQLSPIKIDNNNHRQAYVDFTGASYTKKILNSPRTNDIDDDLIKNNDSITRLSPRLKNDRLSPINNVVSSVPDVIEAHGSKKCSNDDNDGNGDDNKDKPEGERAEAEGCEHTAIESLEEARVSFKGSNKILHNDNIQTLRVIILSEQL